MEFNEMFKQVFEDEYLKKDMELKSKGESKADRDYQSEGAFFNPFTKGTMEWEGYRDRADYYQKIMEQSV